MIPYNDVADNPPPKTGKPIKAQLINIKQPLRKLRQQRKRL
jgi:hypothetical protein